MRRGRDGGLTGVVDREVRGGGEGTRADEERGGATLPGSGRRAGRCAGTECECPQTTDPAPPTGLVSPKNVHLCSKGSDVACAAKKKPHDSGVLLLATEDLRASLLQIRASMAPSAPAPVSSGARWVHHCQPEPPSTRSARRAGGPGRGLGPLTRSGHALSAPGPVSPQGPPARPRPGGRGPHRARSGSAGPGPRRAPTEPGSPPGGRSPPQDAARRPPAPHGPAHS